MTREKILSYDAYADAERSGISSPYVIELINGPQLLTFYGSHHTKDPDDKQFVDLEERWEDFTEHAAKPVVFVEGYSDTWPEQATADRLQSITTGGESSFMVHLARRDGVEVYSPEPDAMWTATKLSDEFGRDNVALFYFLGRLQWLSHTAGNNPDLEAEAAQILSDLKDAYQWENVDFSLESMQGLYQKAVGKQFDMHDQGGLDDSINPTLQETLINSIARRSGDLRDENLIEKIEAFWNEGNSLFVVYGAAHAFRLEQSLGALAVERER